MFVRVKREGDPDLTISETDIRNALKIFCNDKDLTIRGLVVILTDDHAQIRHNRKMLSHDYNTDVITQEYDSPLGVSVEMYINGDTTFMNRGELPINYVLRMVFHGLLHLVGYNDSATNDRIEMQHEEDRLLQLFHVEHKTLRL